MSFIITLTITAQDRSDLGDVMNQLVGLINQGRVSVTMTLDEMIDPDRLTFSTEKQRWNAEYQAKQRKLKARAARAQAKAERDVAALPSAIDWASDQKRAMAKRRREWQNSAEGKASIAEYKRERATKLREIQRIIDAVGCTRCHVGKGQGCVSAHGTLYTTFIHAPRRMAAASK